MSATSNFIGLIQRADEGFIRDNIYMVDKPALARALKNIDAQYQDKIFRNMNSESADEVKRLMDGMGTIPLEDIESSQEEIISLASQAF